MNTNTKTKSEVLAALSLDEHKANQILILDSRRVELREQLKLVNQQFIASLPVASDEQLKAIVMATRYETAPPEGMRLNVDFRLSEAQGQQVEVARRERIAECTRAKEQMVGSMAEDAEEKLVSFKVRVGAKQTTTTLRFVRTHTPVKAAVGLMAALQAVSGLSEASAEVAATS
jgi:hypothetical protein